MSDETTFQNRRFILEIYKLLRNYDAEGNSPWDAVWYDGDDEDLYVLECPAKLLGIWKTPQVRLEKRLSTPDIYGFQLYYAVNEMARDRLARILGNTVEFLPIIDATIKINLYVVHPLLRVDLDSNALTNRTRMVDNFTVIEKYSFSPDQFEEHMHLMTILQGPGSAARDGGYSFGEVLVSSKFKSLCEANHLKGVVFERVWSSD